MFGRKPDKTGYNCGNCEGPLDSLHLRDEQNVVRTPFKHYHSPLFLNLAQAVFQGSDRTNCLLPYPASLAQNKILTMLTCPITFTQTSSVRNLSILFPIDGRYTAMLWTRTELAIELFRECSKCIHVQRRVKNTSIVTL